MTALLRVEGPLTGRAIARITGLSQSTAHRTLTRLRQTGLVVAEQAPPSVLYRVNPDHLAMPTVLNLLHLDDELQARMRECVAEWRPRPVSVIVYGSVARGEATTTSDIDVLVVRPDAVAPDEASWQVQLADLGERLQRWTGRRGSIVEMSREEAARGLIAREPFIVNADRDGWLIAGVAIRQLAGRDG